MHNSTVLIIASAATATVAAPIYNDYAILDKSKLWTSALAPSAAYATRVAIPMPPFHTNSLTVTVPDEWEKRAVATAAASTNVAAAPAVFGGSDAPIVVNSEDEEYEKEAKKVDGRKIIWAPCPIL